MDRRVDENIASVFFGWCLALIVLTSYRIITSFLSCSAYKCIRHLLLSTSLIMMSAMLAILSWTYQIGRFRPGVAEFAVFLTLWSLQAHFYFQIIINRICILDIRRPNQLRLGVGALVLVVNISMYGLWLPSQFTGTSNNLTFWWPRLEKVFYLFIDIILNIVFIRQIQQKLINIGLTKYKRLIHFNYAIIALSITCDVLLLGMQWFPQNNTLYILVHPVIFLNKLIFEMAICDRMAVISNS